MKIITTMEKIYEYNGQHFCDEDISAVDDLYAGDLLDLYSYAKDGTYRNRLRERTVYYDQDNPENEYESAQDLVEEVFKDCIVGEMCKVKEIEHGKCKEMR